MLQKGKTKKIPQFQMFTSWVCWSLLLVTWNHLTGKQYFKTVALHCELFSLFWDQHQINVLLHSTAKINTINTKLPIRHCKSNFCCYPLGKRKIHSGL